MIMTWTATILLMTLAITGQREFNFANLKLSKTIGLG